MDREFVLGGRGWGEGRGATCCDGKGFAGDGMGFGRLVWMLLDWGFMGK